ncbi:flagellar biosynthetic protein FliO [Vibrio neptunius]|uniref:flagellar biosynthetic protein FliO n=1 Tax=Vibrio neptunius TaxID=170651 RepID=UPI0019D0A8FD|nr:flagellar biosynthetic protein FliO [Vibrio neptunius]MBN3575006.1 flagellar biosynthetic protein FliO [Vibrio neptunius]QXX06262.1 flagellar biosynthetic protein FliO [Vibrio neptunius]
MRKQIKGVSLCLFTLLSPSVWAETASGNQLDWATTFGSLLFVVAFILFLAWLLKRMRVPAMINQGGLNIVRQIPVGTRERIMIVQAGEEQFLVGVTAQSVQLISKLDTPLTQEELNKSALASSPFATQLTQLLKKKE